MTDNVNVEKVKKKRLYAILKTVAIIVAVLVVFAISFALFSMMPGSSDLSGGLKADAWSLSGIVNTGGGADWFGKSPSSWVSGTSIFNTPTPMTAAEGFPGTSFNTSGGSSKTWYFYQMYEVKLNKGEIAAANSGYIGEMSFTFKLNGNVGSDFMYNWGRTQYTIFIVAGSSGGGSMGSFTAISGSSQTDGFDKEKTNLTTKKVTYQIPKGTTVVRYGITMQFTFYGRSWYWPGNPTVTFNGVTLQNFTCTKKPLPKLTVNAGPNGYVSSTEYDNHQLDWGEELNSITAIAEEGYYFSGWQITGGTIHKEDTWSSNERNEVDKKSINLALGTSTRVEGTSGGLVTATAQFTKITVNDNQAEFIYKQDSNGNGIGQGPYVNNISGYTLQRYGLSSHESGKNYYSEISGGIQVGAEFETKPFNVGTYRFGLAVMYNGEECGHVVVTFDITGLDLDSVDKHESYPQVSFDKISSGQNIETELTFGSYDYSSLAITPIRDTVYMKFGGTVYTLRNGVDFTWNYSNNVNVGNATAMIYAVEGGNFVGDFSIPFTINRIELTGDNVYYGQSSFAVGNATYNSVSRVTTADGRATQSSDFAAYKSALNNAATTIQRDAGTVYTGFEIRPHNDITVIYVWIYATLDVNTGAKGIVIFPLVSNGCTKFVDESGVERSVNSGTIGSYINLASTKNDSDYQNNINACDYAVDGTDAASVRLYANTTSSQYNVTLSNFKVYFNISKRNFGSAEGEAQGDEMNLIYSGGEQQQKGIKYVFFTIYIGSVVNVPGTDPGPATVVFAATEDGISSPVYDRVPVPGTSAPWDSGLVYAPAYFDIGTADSSGDVSYSDNIDAGTATMTIRLSTRNLEGTVTTTYEIVPLDVTDLPGSGDQGHSYGHTINIAFNPDAQGVGQPVYFDPENAVTPDFNMSITNIYVNGNPLTHTFGTDDYNADGIVYSDNTNAGTATISIPMRGNYTGTYVTNFQISPLELNSSGYVGYVTDSLTYQARALSNENDFAFVYDDVYEISIVGENFTIPYLKVSDYDNSGNPIKQYVLSNVYGKNTDVTDSYVLSGQDISGNAYFTLQFNAVSGDNDLSPNYIGSLRVYFSIGKKYLWTDESAWASASGTEANAENISAASTITEAYDRAEHTPQNDTKLNVTYNNVSLNYITDYTFTGEYRDNVDAGTAYLAIEGTGNYGGKCWVPFTIEPYSIVYKEGSETLSRLTGVTLDYINEATGKIYSDPDMKVEVGRLNTAGGNYEFVYYYKNSKDSNVVMPKITAISVYMDNTPIALTEGEETGDFIVIYSDNGNVGTHTITVEGVNNYTGTDSVTVKFRIEAIQQTVSLSSDIYLGNDVPVMDRELLSKDELKRAEYQISAADMYETGIRVSATTTAIYPAVKAEFMLYEILSDGDFKPVPVASGLYTVTYDEDAPSVDAFGRATTGAVIRFNYENCSGYYIVGASFPGGTNFYTATIAPSAADTSLTEYSDYSVLVKNYDDFEGAVFGGAYTYGDGDVMLPLSMKSGNNPINPSLTSTADSVIEVIGKTDGIMTYSLRVRSAGSTSLTLSHGGYLDPSDYSNVYFMFERSATYTVNQRSLTVFFGKEDGSAWEIAYGDSSFNPGMIQYFTFIGLADGDSAADVAAGFTLNNYLVEEGRDTPAANDYTLTIAGTTQASKYNNYAINLTTYKDYAGLTGDEALNYANLIIKKAALTVTAYTGDISSGNTNIIYKVYGANNPVKYDANYAPDGYKLNYTGFVNGDSIAMLEIEAGFVAPSVDYLDCGLTTETGSHAVTIVGGVSQNYEFIAGAEQYLTVQPAEVNIFVHYTETMFSGSGIGVNYEVKGILDENGEALDDFTFNESKEIIFFYYPSVNNVENYTNAAPRNSGQYGVAIRYLPSDKNGNYKETTKVIYVNADGEEVAVYTDSVSNPVWNALNITPYELEFGYGSGSITAPYDENGIFLSSLLPAETGLSGEVPSGTFSNVEFRNSALGDEAPWINYTIADTDPAKVSLTGGTWDIRFDYTSYNSNYADRIGYVLKNCIMISADAVKFTYIGGGAYSGVYNGSAHELSESDFILTFPDESEFKGNEFPAGETVDGVTYGEFYFGFMPEGTVPDYGQDYEALKNYLIGQNAQAINVGTYSIWVIYIPHDMEADKTYTVISRSESGNNVFEITPKMLTAEDFSFAGRKWVYDASPHTLTFGVDILLNEGVLVGAEAANGQLPGSVRIIFRKDGAEYASIIDHGEYDIILEYTSEQNNNYAMTAGQNVITGNCSIAKRTVEIIYNGQSNLQYTYNGSGRGISANLAGVNGVMPGGSLVYVYYDASGSKISGVPVNVGTYTVGINYLETGESDNFTASASDYNPGVTIVITAAMPSIIIYPVSLSYEEAMNYFVTGDLQSLYSRLYRIMLSGNDTLEKCGTVSVSYGIRTSTGVSWSQTFPFEQGPGSYEIRVTFTSSGANYMNNTQNSAGALTIRLPSPDLDIEAERHTFTGKPISVNSAGIIVSLETGAGTDIYYPAGTPGADKFYYGFINVEYRATGSTGSWSGAPVNADVYDVRLTYTASSEDKMFSNGSAVIENALTIDPVEIRVIPVFGQGKVYDGDFADESAVAYMYSYVIDGVLYFEYAAVTDISTGYRYDISKGEYSDSNAVYTVYGGLLTEGENGKLYAEQWRDYELYSVEITEAVCSVGGVSYTADISGAAGIVDIEIGGTAYKLDADRMIIYPAVSEGSGYTVTGGIYLSYTSPDGGVYVVKVDTNSANYVYDESADTASYAFVRDDGVRVDATLDFGRGTADDFRGRVYTIIETAAALQTADGTLYIDFAKLTNVSADGDSAVYKTAAGGCYLILTEESLAVEAYPLTVTKVSFGDVIVDVTALEKGDFNGEYVYETDAGRFILDVVGKTAKKALYYAVTETENGYSIDYNGVALAFAADGEDVTVIAENYVVFESAEGVFYVDLDDMKARSAENRSLYDLSVADVPFDEFLYTLYDADGNPVAKAPLFGNRLDVAGSVLTGVDVSGSVFVSGALNNGYYKIESDVSSSSANYIILKRIPEVYYFIDRKPVTIDYTAPDDLVYDGNNKIVGYEISGVVEGENVNIILTCEGDNTNVTEEGFRIRATLTGGNDNYYLEGGVSEYYYIELAEMNDPVWALTTTVVYDGLMHTVELSVDDGAKVTYLTESRFVEPGTYSISVTVSKPNYRTISSSVLLTIKKAVFSVVPDAFNGKLVYGDDLPELTANTAGIDGTQLGSVVLDPGQQLVPGTHEYTWSFLPYDPVSFYSRYDGVNGGDIRGSIQLIVEKAQAAIEIFTNLDQSETNPLAIIGSVNGSSLNELEGVTIEYVDGAGNRFSSLPTSAGRYTVVVTYEGDELYAETVKEFVLTIEEEESNFEWLYYVLGALTVLAIGSLIFFLMKRGKKYE